MYEFRAKIDDNMNVIDTEWLKLEEDETYENDAFLPLLNKKSIIKYATKAIEESNGETGYLCMFDLDNFKDVNDNYGHLFGDEVLINVSKTVNKVIAGRGVAGRIGGDELLIVFDKILTKPELQLMLKKLREAIEKIYKKKLGEFNVTVTIGACEYPVHAKNYEDAFKIADAMLYRGKEKGKNRYIIYTPDIHGDILNVDMKQNISKNSKIVTNKEALVLMILQEHLHDRKHTFTELLGNIGEAFCLDEICVIKNDNNVLNLYEREKDEKERTCEFAKDEQFSKHFTENNFIVINEAKYASQFSQDATKYVDEHAIKSMLVYRMDVYGGFIYFINKSDSGRGWDRRDVTMLNIIGKALEISLEDR